MKDMSFEPSFSNAVVDKSELKKIIVWAFRNYGIARAANMADKLKDIGFYYATKAGISLSLEDLRIPPIKQNLLKTTISSILEADSRYKRGEITAVERFQKVIDTWNNSSETLKKEVIQYFKDTDPLNTIYMMAFSGARGNISQVRQLVGMRGLMSDPQGQIIDLPITSNFREGLTVTDYFISSYGARKGLVDTALRTADSGYLTRRLVDVAQDVIIREVDCKTSRGILLEDTKDNQKLLMSLEQSLVGRLLADDLYHPNTGQLIASCNQDINQSLASSILSAKIKKVLVRSPVTCDSVASVCQMCYGWNLAHGRLVDLGEAVGIIAAQSIGEPGTQLTMRTFHTGGVFTGEFAERIYAPIDCTVEYPQELHITKTRTSHGDTAYLINEDSIITLSNNDDKTSLPLPLGKGTLLLVSDRVTVVKNQVIAEYPLRSRLTTEKAQKSVITDLSGEIHFSDLIVEEVQDQQHMVRNTQRGGLVWVLSGRVYNIPDNAQITVSLNDIAKPGTLLARIQIISKYGGCVSLSTSQTGKSSQEISIITACQVFANVKVYIDKYYANNNYILEIYNKDKFILNVVPNQKLVDQQIIGNLVSDIYKTSTGGIIKYLDLLVSKTRSGLHNEYYDICSSGYVLWIPEETHEINKDISLLLVAQGDFVESGTEIIKNVFAQTSGIVELLEKDGVVREVVIKPGSTYRIREIGSFDQMLKKRGFLRPGEVITDNIKTDKLVYWEYISSSKDYFVLIRPVVVYSIPKKSYIFTYTEKSFATDRVCLKLVRRIYFKDGERVKSVNGVELVKTHLIVEIPKDIANLNCFIELSSDSSTSQNLKFKLVVADNLFIKNTTVSETKDISTITRILVQNNVYIKSGEVIAQTEILSTLSGKVAAIRKKESYGCRLLVLTDLDHRIFSVAGSQLIKVKEGDWVYIGDEIASGIKSLDSGRIVSVSNREIILRIGRPYLISDGAILHLDHMDLVRRGENIATLIFERAKTGDIIQGLPRIEEILEARRKSDNLFNLHVLLDNKFRFYLGIGLGLYDATRISIQEIQSVLVREIQLVYKSQGVDISDKHIEVIVRQMTSKVKIESGGDTEYLPGEMIELQRIEVVNKSLAVMNKKQALYHPILLGITKASLNTESFISAASFQETTKVLTDAAISGKLDWLRGLKENVIIGRLIPAGTGFNMYNNASTSDCSVPTNKYVTDLCTNNRSVKNKEADFEDIILDDRSARNFSLLENNADDLPLNTDII
uniref:DNA-directed RNA polymerase n=1 Tax=Rhodogorgon sp. TaxID=2485824 RepID=A0A3G3MI33_9FLOR|nr:RNA polymerase beta'' subunit [Rhodogorgon sp.]